MKTKSTLIILILTCISFFVNAQLAGNTFQLDMGEQGKFNLKFNEKTYELLTPQGEQLVIGDYTVEKDMVSFIDKGGLQACQPGTVGKYKFNVEKGQMVLELVEDDCEGRPSMAAGVWKQIEN